MTQMINFGLLAGNKEVIHDLIRLPDSTTKEKSACALYKTIEKAYKNFQIEINNILENEKKENWRAVNLDYFNKIEESLHQSEVWASCTSR